MKTSILLGATALIAFGAISAQATSTVVTTTTAPVAVAPATAATSVQVNPDGSTTKTTTTYYVNYDANHNGILDSQEFYKYVWTAWDTNRDGYLSPDEWKVSSVRWYGPTNTAYKTYTYWDKNGDGRVDPSEFDTTVSTTNLYNTWDTSGSGITNDTYASQSFRVYDTNGDGVLSLDEWKAAL